MAIKQICVLVALFVLASDALTWKNCDSSSPVQIKEINVSPDPLKLKAGTKVSLSAKFQVTGNAGLKYNLKLKVQKKAGWFWIPIPCVSGKYGSCTIKNNPKLTCDSLKVLINEQKCPLSQKLYQLTHEKVLPNISVPSFLTKGNYFVRADMRDSLSNRRIACVEVYAKVVV